MSHIPTPAEMFKELNGDNMSSLRETYIEYAAPNSDELQPKVDVPEVDKGHLIKLIILLMQKAGDVQEIATFKLSDLARTLGIDPKTARQKLRQASTASNSVPARLTSGWVFSERDREAITRIIRPKS